MSKFLLRRWTRVSYNDPMLQLDQLIKDLKASNRQEVARLAGVSAKTLYRLTDKGGPQVAPLHETVTAIDAALKAIKRKAKPACIKASTKARDAAIKAEGAA